MLNPAAAARSDTLLPFRRSKRRKVDERQLSLRLWPCPAAAETADLLARLLNVIYNGECIHCGGCRRSRIKHHVTVIVRDYYGG